MSTYYNTLNTSSYDDNYVDVGNLLLSDNRSYSQNSLTETDIDVKNTTEQEQKDEFKNHNVRDLSWKVLDSYYANKNRLIEHHINSFEHLIDMRIPSIFKNYNISLRCNYNEITKKYSDRIVISFCNFSIRKPAIKSSNGEKKNNASNGC